jgi:hypothetical protein
LVVAEREGIELDCCPWCHGLWFDAGELALLAEKAGRALPPGEGSAEETTDAREAPRFCPRCDRKMDKTALGSAPRVTLDRCGAGHGLWFDRGELGSLMGQLAARPGSHPEALLRFMGEVFGPGPGAPARSSESNVANREEVER